MPSYPEWKREFQVGTFARRRSTPEEKFCSLLIQGYVKPLGYLTS
jgi:hypothetical protein